MIADLAEQKVTASIANAMCNAGGKILKMVELEIRYGQQVPGQNRRLITISGTYTESKNGVRGKGTQPQIAPPGP